MSHYFFQRVKESTADVRNRVGLSELIMDPVQRIPRYTLLWNRKLRKMLVSPSHGFFHSVMLKHMVPNDPQRPKLLEATQIAQKIAECEIDDSTRRAAVMHCFRSTIDGFPVCFSFYFVTHSLIPFLTACSNQ